MSESYLKVRQNEVIDSLLTVFVYAEQKAGDWDKLEESIATVKYEEFSERYKDWFIEFLYYACFRVWNGCKDDELNRVKDEEQAFMVINYDWNAFKFGKQKGLDPDLTTRKILCIDKDNLTEQEIKWLKSKCK